MIEPLIYAQQLPVVMYSAFKRQHKHAFCCSLR